MYFLVYLLTVSAVAAVAVISDKHRAVRRKRRIPEAVLFAVAAVGGSAAMYLTMCLIRHKTQKNRFVFGIPLIFIMQCVIIYMFLKEGKIAIYFGT